MNHEANPKVMKRSFVFLGVLTGCTAATVLVAHADSANPILRPVVSFLGMLGFILGYVHQGREGISIAADLCSLHGRRCLPRLSLCGDPRRKTRASGAA
jgi:hypothetical protein